MFALVDDRQWYAIANFKETYLQSIRPARKPTYSWSLSGKALSGCGNRHRLGQLSRQYEAARRTAGGSAHPELGYSCIPLPVRIEIHERATRASVRMGMTAFVTVLDRPAKFGAFASQ